MRKNHHQTIVLSVLIAITIIAFSAQSVFAGDYTKSVSNNDTLTVRDITNFDPEDIITSPCGMPAPKYSVEDAEKVYTRLDEIANQFYKPS